MISVPYLNFPALPALLATSTFTKISRGLFDDTFAGIHQLSWFDWMLLVPYFAILGILSIYGMHRFDTMHTFFKHRKKVQATPPDPEVWPRITIQLPLYNERYVLERLLEETLRVEYPKDRLQIQVLDDSTDDTHPFAEALCEKYLNMGYPIEYKHRTNRHGYKAGALQEGLETATGEIVAVFDADFLPPADFLLRTVPHFGDSNVGVVQTRWTYLNREFNVLTEVQTMLLDGHFVLEHGARSRAGHFFNFNGTAGLLRVKMITDAGGWQHDTLTEDSDLSYRAQVKGWKFVYLPSVECPSELPVEMHGFQVQQFRWAKGLMQVAIKLLPTLMKADIPRRTKIEAFMHLTPNVSYPLMLVLSALMLPVMIVRFYMGVWQMMLIDLPLIIASFWSISAFYVIAQRELYPKTWKRSFAFLPALITAGIGLSIINSRAVLEAAIGKKSEFVRTPKYAIEGTQQVKAAVKKYRSRSGWLPYLELGAGTYFLYMCWFAIETYNYPSLPFLSLFVAGYYWAAISTLWQEHQDRRRYNRIHVLELQTAK